MKIQVVFLLFVASAFSASLQNATTTITPSVIHETLLDGSVYDTLTITEDISFLITSASSLYRTADGGKTWVNQNSTLPYWFVAPGIVGMVAGADPQIVYFYGNEEASSLWLTSNGGLTYLFNDFTSNYFSVYYIQPHPVLPYVAAGTFLNYGPDGCIPTTDSNCYFLFFTHDGGINWSIGSSPYPATNLYLTAGYTPYFSWGLAGQPGHPNGECFAILAYNYTATVKYPVFYHSTDYFNTTATAPFSTSTYFYTMYYDETNQVFLFLSYTQAPELYIAPASTLQLQKAILPQNTTSPNELAILDVSPGSIVVGAHIPPASYSSFQLFTSDVITGDFQLSLPRLVVSNTTKEPDFFEVPGFQGIFIVNQWGDPPATTMQSRITFDNGLTWNPISPPSGSTSTCANCTFNIFGGYSFLQEFDVAPDKYSYGVLIASGIVSTTLQGNTGNLYLSRDAGHTWTLLQTGNWIFDSSSTQDFIIIAKYNTPSNNLFFTLNQGLTWTEFVFNNDSRAITISQISTNFAGQPNSLWLQGSWTEGSVLHNSLFYVYLNLTLRACVASDYETFVATPGQCVLGEQTTIQRKKQASECIANSTTLTSTVGIPCNCTQEDYTCDSCYIQDINQACVFNSASCVLTPPPICPPGTNFSTAPAYQRVVGTACVNNLAYLLVNITQPCPPPAPSTTTPSVAPTTPTSGTPSAPATPTSGTPSAPTTPTSGTPSAPTTPTSGTPSAPTSTPSTTPTNNGTVNADNSQNLAIDTTGWIIIGVIIGVIIIVIIVILVVRHVQKKQKIADYETEI